MLKVLIILLLVFCVLLLNLKINEKKKILFISLSFVICLMVTVTKLSFSSSIEIKNIIYLDNFSKYSDWAVEEMNRSGVYASITLAQASQETTFGTCENCSADGNNWFGIQQDNINCVTYGPGSTYPNWDGERKGIYRKYSSVRKSFADHSDWLLNCFHGRHALRAASNVEGQLRAIGENCYASPGCMQYACTLAGIINDHNLTKYDGNEHKIDLDELGCNDLDEPDDGNDDDDNGDTEEPFYGIPSKLHFTTSYGGDLKQGWLYLRTRAYEDPRNEHYDGPDIMDDAIDEIFYRAMMAYTAQPFGNIEDDYDNLSEEEAASCEEMEGVSAGSPESWRQGGNSPWRNIGLGGSTMHEVGCLITSIAIQMARAGVSGGINNLNPGTLACYLSNAGAFTDGGALKGNQYIPANILGSQSVSGTREQQAQAMQAALDSGQYPIVYAPYYKNGEKHNHFVAVVGTTADNIIIADPGAGYKYLWGPTNVADHDKDQHYYNFNSTTSYRAILKQ